MSTNRIRFNLDTTMWNEGFEKAQHPWLTVYTERAEIAQALVAGGPYQVRVPDSRFPQHFEVQHDELDVSDAATLQKMIDEMIESQLFGLEDHVDPDEYISVDTPVLVDADAERLDAAGVLARVQARLAQWQGI